MTSTGYQPPSKRALIVKLGQIGDVIMAIPAVHALHEQGYEIHWICGEAVRPLLECYSWVKPISASDKEILLGRPFARLRGILLLWRKLAFQRFDLCATLYYDRRYLLLTLPVFAGRKIALSRQSRATTLIAGRHHTDEYGRVLLGVEDSCREESLRPVGLDLLPPSNLGQKSSAIRIALVAGGVQHLIREQAEVRLPEQALRRWPIENFVTLARLLLARGWEVVLLGGPGDEWVKPYFKDLTVTDCIGTLSLPMVVSVCNASDAVVTHDTGPLHLAGLSNTCVVGIFGPTDPSTRVPRRPFAVGIWGGRGYACRPCYDGRDFAPCRFNGCMHQVTPELVLRELDRLLNVRSKGGSSAWEVVCPDCTRPST